MKLPRIPWWLLAGLCCLFLAQPCLLHAQWEDYDRVLDHLELELRQGNTKALRDVGSLLDQPVAAERAVNLLTQHTLFTNEELTIDTTLSRKTFLDFYYDQEKKIQFSSLLRSFYITPIEQQPIEYKLLPQKRKEYIDKSTLLRRNKIQLENALKKEDIADANTALVNIGHIQTKESNEYLRELLKGNMLLLPKDENPSQLIQVAAQQLSFFPELSSLTLVLDLVDHRRIPLEIADPILSQITNVNLITTIAPDQVIDTYRKLADSLTTLENWKTYGYQRAFNLHPSFFQFLVDYYGNILGRAKGYPWIRWNARRDLIQSGHPRSLFYLAGLLYRFRDSPGQEKAFAEILNILNQHIDVDILLPINGKMTTQYDLKNDEKAMIAFIRFWATQYQNFEWDGVRQKFINKEVTVVLTENYERLFRRLNSPNDSVAMQAYLLLSEGDPVEVTALSKKYKNLLRNYNRSLPALNSNFLEQLVQLTSYCRRNYIRYKAPAHLQSLLIDLGRVRDDQDRYQIENQIITRLQPDEVTALEYWGCLNESQIELSFSVGRILDYFYSKQWNKIVTNEKWLRLYLKKSAIFENIGVIGVCNDYLLKFEPLQKSEKRLLEDLLRTESDKDIATQIKILLEREKSIKKMPKLTELIKQIELLSSAELHDIPVPQVPDWEVVMDFFRDDTSAKGAKNMWFWLRSHPDVQFTPIAMQMLDEEMQTKEVLEWLSTVYQSTQLNDRMDWLAFYAKDPNGYGNWKQQFFEENIAIITRDSFISIDIVNAIAASPLYDIGYKNTCLAGLTKVRPASDVRRLKMPHLLSVEQDLIYFDPIKFNGKQLDEIPKLFDLRTGSETLVDWLFKKSDDFSLEEKVGFFNNLFHANWFADYVYQNKLKLVQKTHLETIFETYINTSDFLSEFIEMETSLHLQMVKISDLTLQQKIIASIQANLSDKNRLKIQKMILARVAYSDLDEVFPYLSNLMELHTYNFLHSDFGIPVFDLEETKIEEIADTYKEQSQLNFYKFFLRKFGVDFETPSGTLDYEKIAQLLEYEIVTPFVGEGGLKRDYFVYGLIKILELQFNTTLNFHIKLNENQTFYTYSSSKRAAAWFQYLKENGYVRKKSNTVPSFNASLDLLDIKFQK